MNGRVSKKLRRIVNSEFGKLTGPKATARMKQLKKDSKGKRLHQI